MITLWCFGTAAPASVLLHGAHHSLTVAGVAGVVWILFPAAWADAVRRRIGGPDAGAGVGWIALAVVATAAAATVHLAVVPGHLRPDAGVWMGPALLVAGLLQALAAYAVARRPEDPVRLTGALALHAASILTWLVSRTVGLPEAVYPGGRALMGTPDVLAVAWQLLAVVALAVLLRNALPQGHDGSGTPRLVRWSAWPPGARVQAGLAGLSIVALVTTGGLL